MRLKNVQIYVLGFGMFAEKRENDMFFVVKLLLSIKYFPQLEHLPVDVACVCGEGCEASVKDCPLQAIFSK